MKSSNRKVVVRRRKRPPMVELVVLWLVVFGSITPSSAIAEQQPPAADYIGCFVDTGRPRDLGSDQIGSNIMSVDVCHQHCFELGTAYFGLQYSTQCFCGDNYGKYGESSAAECNRPCPGNAQETCGGYYRNSIYKTGLPEPPPPPQPRYVGCYIDQSTRDINLATFRSDVMTARLCQGFCDDKGAKYFGLQAGAHCFCGESYGAYGAGDEASCNQTCRGNSLEICGGNWRNSVYETSPDGGGTSSLAPSPVGLVAEPNPNGQEVVLNWPGYDEDGQQVMIQRYEILVAHSSFTEVAAATVVKVVPAGTKTALIGGLSPGTYHFAVLARSQFGVALDALPTDNVIAVKLGDTTGPLFGVVEFDGDASPPILTTNANVQIDITDESGVALANMFWQPANSQEKLNLGAGNRHDSVFSWDINLVDLVDGDGSFIFEAVDSRGNAAQVAVGTQIALAPPPPPEISQPADNSVVASATNTITGRAGAAVEEVVISRGAEILATVTSFVDGGFSVEIVLMPGQNEIAVTARNRAGSSEPRQIVVSLDATMPTPPSAVTAKALVGGEVLLSWEALADLRYHVYRSYEPSTSAPLRLTSEPVRGGIFKDLPDTDGLYSYRLTAVSQSVKESVPSMPATASSDRTPPTAQLTCQTKGAFDPDTQRFGQGIIGCSLTVAEPLLTAPFLAVVPSAGSQIPLHLTEVSPQTFDGSFELAAGATEGAANMVFSARDLAGNRGESLLSGGVLHLDSKAPSIVSTVVNPGSLVKVETTTMPQVSLELTFSESLANAPEIIGFLSGENRSPLTAIVSSSDESPGLFSAEFILPADVAIEGREILTYTVSVADTLSNHSVYAVTEQPITLYRSGSLPPPVRPHTVTGISQPEGKVSLRWEPVPHADDYEVLRRDDGTNSYVSLARTGGQNAFVDLPSTDKEYLYTVKAIRKAGAEESVSTASDEVAVLSDRAPPDIPTGLTANLTGVGVELTWQIANEIDVVTYQLIRSDNDTGDGGVEALAAELHAPSFTDRDPNPAQPFYFVVATDHAGNRSQPSAVVSINIAVPPVRNLTAEQIGADPPIVKWQAPRGDAATYKIEAADEDGANRLTNSQAATIFREVAFQGKTRTWTVAAQAGGTDSLPVGVTLPELILKPIGTLTTGVINRGQLRVVNASSADLKNVAITLTASDWSFQWNEPLLAAGDNLLTFTWPGSPAAGAINVTLVGHNETADSSWRIVRTVTFPMTTGTLAMTASIESAESGGFAKVKVRLRNTATGTIEVITATNWGADPSTDLDCSIVDSDGNEFARAGLFQPTGSAVLTKPNGVTVATIPPGKEFIFDPIVVAMPKLQTGLFATVKLHRVHQGIATDNQMSMPAGVSSTLPITSEPPVYNVTIERLEPASSFGLEPIALAGRLTPTDGSTISQRLPLRLILQGRNGERSIATETAADGSFEQTITPTQLDEGEIVVSVTHHPVAYDQAASNHRPEHGRFVINRIKTLKALKTVALPPNFATEVTVDLSATKAVGGLMAQIIDPVTRMPPFDLSIEAPGPLLLASGSNQLSFRILSGANVTPASGQFLFQLTSGEVVVGEWPMTYQTSAATPKLSIKMSGNSTIATNPGVSVLSELELGNIGIIPAQNVVLSLRRRDRTNLEPWITLGSQPNIAGFSAGESRPLLLQISPPTGTPDSDIAIEVVATAANAQTVIFPLNVVVTSAGTGSQLFHVIDLFTGTAAPSGEIRKGLAGATLKLEHELLADQRQTLTTDSNGEVLASDLASGRYRYRINAKDYTAAAGIVTIVAGVTNRQTVFLERNLINIEWNVREITIADRYEVAVDVEFETDVPAPVLGIEPPYLQVPPLPRGDAFHGEFKVCNHGLLRVDNLTAHFPRRDPDFLWEPLVSVPPALNPKDCFTLPYRILALRDLTAVSPPQSSDCYDRRLEFSGTWICKAGIEVGTGASTTLRSPGHRPSHCGCTLPQCRDGAATTVSGGGGGGNGGRIEFPIKFLSSGCGCEDQRNEATCNDACSSEQGS